jgi:hypothetical protein
MCKICSKEKLHAKELCKTCFNREWRSRNRKKQRHSNKQWKLRNPDKVKESNSKWCQDNKDHIRIRSLEYELNRSKIDIDFKLRKILRSRVYHAIKNNQKVGSAVSDLGCTIDYLRSYLESKFLLNMTWENYGFYGWHIDHIIPLDSFDLTNREEFLKACHYTNLQPLWRLDNILKSNKI